LGSLYNKFNIYYDIIFKNGKELKRHGDVSFLLNSSVVFDGFKRDISELLDELSKLDISSEEFKSKNIIRIQILEKIEEILECIFEQPYGQVDDVSVENFVREYLTKINDFIFELN
jgi:hypothetical protein